MSTPREIPSLNGLRAVSIALVIWGHSGIRTLIDGSTGVTVFFFISGYLITTIMIREHTATGRVSVRKFYLRRAFRILPPLYVVLAAAVLISLAGWIVNEMTFGGVSASAFFGANYYIIDAGRDGLPGGMSALWSLAVEEHYYLAFPFIFIALTRLLPRRTHQAIVLGAFCVGVLAWRLILSANGADFDRLYLSTDTRVDSILIGATFALVASPELLNRRLSHRPGTAWLLLVTGTLVFVAAARLTGDAKLTVVYTIQGVALLAVFASLIGNDRTLAGRFLGWWPVEWVGVLSYSLYLVHRPALLLAERYIPGPQAVGAAVAIVVSLALAYLIYVAIEGPFRKRRRALGY